MLLTSSKKVLQKAMSHLANKSTAFYLSCPSGLLIQLQVLLGQSCIFTLYLLQLDLLSETAGVTTPVSSDWPSHLVLQHGSIAPVYWWFRMLTGCCLCNGRYQYTALLRQISASVADDLLSSFSHLCSLKTENEKAISLNTIFTHNSSTFTMGSRSQFSLQSSLKEEKTFRKIKKSLQCKLEF